MHAKDRLHISRIAVDRYQAGIMDCLAQIGREIGVRVDGDKFCVGAKPRQQGAGENARARPIFDHAVRCTPVDRIEHGANGGAGRRDDRTDAARRFEELPEKEQLA